MCTICNQILFITRFQQILLESKYILSIDFLCSFRIADRGTMLGRSVPSIQKNKSKYIILLTYAAQAVIL